MALRGTLLLFGLAVCRAPAPGGHASLPLELVSEVPLPGNATRLDYQDLDSQRGHLIIAHMGDSEVVVTRLSDGSTLKRLPGVATVRGIVVANEVNRFFASAI